MLEAASWRAHAAREGAMIGSERAPRYRAYLLRLWETPPADESTVGGWRCSLEDPHTGERRGFPTLDLLFAFLSGVLAEHRAAELAQESEE
jgi:hypothetical protein